jgi:hypothetical protein
VPQVSEAQLTEITQPCDEMPGIDGRRVHGIALWPSYTTPGFLGCLLNHRFRQIVGSTSRTPLASAEAVLNDLVRKADTYRTHYPD